MEDYKRKYYEWPNHWSKDFSEIPAQRERLKEIIKAIPNNVETILDVGCGNGFFINSLRKSNYKRLVGLDFSREALKHVKVEKVLGNIANLPFENNIFDLVTCLEVLEHLPQEDFQKGILELQRVSKKYILITVPNDDDLEHSLVMCPKCYCLFNPYFHMRSFNKEKLKALFNHYGLTELKAIGPLVKKCPYPLSLLTFYRSWGKPLPPATAVCPQCGFRSADKKAETQRKTSLKRKIFILLKVLAKLIWRPKEKKQWLLALYKKRNDG